MKAELTALFLFVQSTLNYSKKTSYHQLSDDKKPYIVISYLGLSTDVCGKIRVTIECTLPG